MHAVMMKSQNGTFQGIRAIRPFSGLSSIIAISLTLTACGGSSSSPSQNTLAPTPLPPPPTPVSTDPGFYETAEYNADWSLDAIKASAAYARGFTGAGAIIGFVDFGFELNNDEVDWHPLSQDKNQTWITMYESYLGVQASDSNHGQWVASIAAARKNDFAIQGVAFDAQVLGIDFFAGVAMHTEFSGGVTYHVSDPWGYVVNNGARVVNKSIGYDEEDFISNPPATNGNEHYTTTNAARVVELGGLLVAAAGNDGDPDPMVSNIDTLDVINQNNLWLSGGYFLVVGSLNDSGVISDFSDRAGVLKDYYLVAPGEAIAVNSLDFPDSGMGVGDGTSFAAPHVVGAAALLFAQWPQLDAFEVADILLTTATDLGVPGVDSVYGHGLLNLDEATKPTGQTTVAVKDAVSPVILGSSMMVMGPAFGDAQPGTLSSVMILDSYDRDFYVDARSAVLGASTGLNLTSTLDFRRAHNQAGWQLESGLQANMVMTSDSLSFGAHRDTMTDLERTTQRQTVQAWHISGRFDKDSSWVMGQGRGLGAALDMLDRGAASNSDLFLTGFRQNIVGSTDALFMAGGFALGASDSLSFGLMTGDTQGLRNLGVTALQEDVSHYGVETRLTRHFDGGHLSLGLGALLEEKAVLGSRSTAGFALADQTVTGRLSVRGGLNLAEKWTLGAQATGGLSDVRAGQNSLFQGFNRFLSSQWAITLTGHNLFADGDRLGFNISQPLRVENARLTTAIATHFDLVTDAPAFAVRQVSLTPSGREISLELGYHLKSGPWSLNANLIRRFDAGHRAGQNDLAVLLSASKRF